MLHINKPTHKPTQAETKAQKRYMKKFDDWFFAQEKAGRI